VLKRSPTEAFQVDVVDDLLAEFQKEERRSCLEKSDTRVCDRILGLPFGRVRLADQLEEAVERLWVEQAVRWEVDAMLESLWSSAARVQDLVLERPSGTSSFTVSLS
jgi:predicted naringenin-chalcone synthase